MYRCVRCLFPRGSDLPSTRRSRLVLIRGENHSLSRCGRPVQRIKRLYEIRKWLDAHLK